MGSLRMMSILITAIGRSPEMDLGWHPLRSQYRWLSIETNHLQLIRSSLKNQHRHKMVDCKAKLGMVQNDGWLRKEAACSASRRHDRRTNITARTCCQRALRLLCRKDRIFSYCGFQTVIRNAASLTRDASPMKNNQAACKKST